MTTAAPSPQQRDPGSRKHRVHPRWVWVGLALTLLGAGLAGWGVARLSAPLSITGLIVLLVGLSTGLAAGLMSDATTGLAVGTELEQVLHADVHEGMAPGDQVRTPRARADAAATTAMARDVLRRSRQHGPVALAPLAGWILLGIAVFIASTQSWFVADTATGRDSAFRDLGLAILLGMSGLRIATGSGRRSVAVVIAGLAGVGLLLGGLLADHSRIAIVVVEIGCGIVAVLAATAAGLRPSRSARAEADESVRD